MLPVDSGDERDVGTTGSLHVSTKYKIFQDSTQHWRMWLL